MPLLQELVPQPLQVMPVKAQAGEIAVKAAPHLPDGFRNSIKRALADLGLVHLGNLPAQPVIFISLIPEIGRASCRERV